MRSLLVAAALGLGLISAGPSVAAPFNAGAAVSIQDEASPATPVHYRRYSHYHRRYYAPPRYYSHRRYYAPRPRYYSRPYYPRRHYYRQYGYYR